MILEDHNAAEALAWSRCILERIGLALNPTKTRLVDARTGSFDFLGYTFGPERYRKDGHWYLTAKPSKKAVRQLRERVRGLLRPGNHLPRAEVVARLNRTLRGWATYSSYGTRLMAYRAVDNYVYDHVRHFLRRRHKVPTRGARRFPRSWSELGVQRLRPLHVGRLP
jgi:RNA-directed DNA polymerase